MFLMFMDQNISKHNTSYVHEATGEDPVPVTFRYEIHPKESKVTHVFRPRSEQSTQGTTIFRPQSLGQVLPVKKTLQ